MNIRTQKPQSSRNSSNTRVVWRKVSEPRSWLQPRERQVWTLSPVGR